MLMWDSVIRTPEPAPASSLPAMGLFCWAASGPIDDQPSTARRSFAECYRLPQDKRPELDDGRGILTGTTSANNRTNTTTDAVTGTTSGDH